MKANMVIASSDATACRVFIVDTDFAIDFASWLQLNGWHARIEDDVDPRTQPRIYEEEALAGALVAQYDRWKKENGR